VNDCGESGDEVNDVDDVSNAVKDLDARMLSLESHVKSTIFIVCEIKSIITFSKIVFTGMLLMVVHIFFYSFSQVKF
jgi:hypothetical protein